MTRMRFGLIDLPSGGRSVGRSVGRTNQLIREQNRHNSIRSDYFLFSFRSLFAFNLQVIKSPLLHRRQNVKWINFQEKWQQHKMLPTSSEQVSFKISRRHFITFINELDHRSASRVRQCSNCGANATMQFRQTQWHSLFASSFWVPSRCRYPPPETCYKYNSENQTNGANEEDDERKQFKCRLTEWRVQMMMLSERFFFLSSSSPSLSCFSSVNCELRDTPTTMCCNGASESVSIQNPPNDLGMDWMWWWTHHLNYFFCSSRLLLHLAPSCDREWWIAMQCRWTTASDTYHAYFYSRVPQRLGWHNFNRLEEIWIEIETKWKPFKWSVAFIFSFFSFDPPAVFLLRHQQ